MVYNCVHSKNKFSTKLIRRRLKLKKFYRDIISDEEREYYISNLTDELPFLRIKAGVSQDDLAGLLGVSRQTYGSIERRDRRMTWNTYLSLIFFFDNKKETRSILRSTEAFPHKFINSMNAEESAPEKIMSKIQGYYPEVLDKLDDNAINTIRTLIMIEYARCTNQPGEAVVRAFNGMNFMTSSSKNAKVDDALKKIKGKADEEDGQQ